MGKHTPARLAIYEHDGLVYVKDADGRVARIADEHRSVRLIAAAPDLLEALEGWLKLHSFRHTSADIFAQADKSHAALAKAKGETASGGSDG